MEQIELLTPAELEKVKFWADLADSGERVEMEPKEIYFLANLVVRIANKAKDTNEQCNRTIRLLRAFIKEML